MKKIIIMIIFIVLVSSAYAENINFFNISKCSGEINIRANLGNTNLNDYNLLGCTKQNSKMWSCPCSNKILTLRTNQTNHYNFLIQYYINQKTDDDKRVYNIDVNSGKVSKKPIWQFPPIKMNILMSGIFLGIILIGFILTFFIKKFMNSSDNRIDKEDYDYRPTSMRTDEEVLEERKDKKEMVKLIDKQYQEARRKVKEDRERKEMEKERFI